MFKFQRRTITLQEKFAKSDPYYVLGVARDSSLKDVKKIYFHKAKKYHPDLNPGDENAKKMFLEI